jgi:uncharacterized protein GlcG (DUF336 family)
VKEETVRRLLLTAAAAGAAAVVSAIVLQAGSSSAAATPSSTAPQAAAATTTTDNAAGVRSQKVLKLATAQKFAGAAVAACAKKGFPVSAVVVDPDGVEIVVLRADGTTGATVATAKGKAFAAAGFQSPTSGLAAAIPTNPGLVTVPGFVLLAGGEPVRSGGVLVAGVGVSGAPSGDIDDSCAQAGLAAIARSL